MKKIVIILIGCLLFPISGLPETKDISKLDGNDWREWDSSLRAGYIGGFVVGTGYVCRNISDKGALIMNKFTDSDYLKAIYLWGQAHVNPSKKKSYSHEEVQQILRFQNSWDRTEIDRYVLKSGTVGQIKDGLDVLYDDFKNRQILLADAFYVVKKQIGGSSPEEIETILQMLRSPDKHSKKSSLEFIDKDGKKKTVEFP